MVVTAICWTLTQVYEAGKCLPFQLSLHFTIIKQLNRPAQYQPRDLLHHFYEVSGSPTMDRLHKVSSEATLRPDNSLTDVVNSAFRNPALTPFMLILDGMDEDTRRLVCNVRDQFRAFGDGADTTITEWVSQSAD